MLFEVQDLVVHYNKVLALKGITLQVEENSIVALIGANGAGKTTFLRSVSGLKQRTSGQIFLNGKRIDEVPPHERVKMGIAHVPEGRRIFPRLTVHENIMIGSHTRKNTTQLRTELEHVYHQFPILKARQSQAGGSLSGGEQQMLALARALMVSPKLLLLDEPSMGLSPIIVREIAKNIINIRNTRQIGVIFVEQNARLALKLSEIGYVLENGAIVLQGQASMLLKDDHVRKAYLGG